MRTSRAAMVLGIAASLGLGACKKSGDGAPPAAPACGGEAERAEGEEWLAQACHEEAATTGQATTVVFSGTGKAPWHVNPEYPAKLEAIAAEGFTLPAPVLRADAAAKFDQSELRFEVPLTPTLAGERPVQFKFKFGLCNADRCVTREALLGWTYAVGGG